MATKPKVGVLVMALFEDDYKMTAHMRPLAQKAADRIGAIIGQCAETICPPLMEEEYQAEAAAQMFNRVPTYVEMAKSRNELPAWSLNTDAHLRSVMMGRSQTIPIFNGAMELGEFGRIYFADFDQTRARERTVIVQLIGE